METYTNEQIVKIEKVKKTTEATTQEAINTLKANDWNTNKAIAIINCVKTINWKK